MKETQFQIPNGNLIEIARDRTLEQVVADPERERVPSHATRTSERAIERKRGGERERGRASERGFRNGGVTFD